MKVGIQCPLITDQILLLCISQMIKSLISGALYFSKNESLQDSKELYNLSWIFSWEFTNYHSQVIVKQKVSRTRQFKNCMGGNFSEILTAVVSEVLSIKCNCCAFFSLQAESTPLIFKPSWHQTNSQSVWWHICICIFQYLYLCCAIVVLSRYLSSACSAW